VPQDISGEKGMKQAKNAKDGNDVRHRFARAGLASRSSLFGRGDLALHAMIVSAGHERRAEATYDWHGLQRGPAEFALFQYTLSGAGRLRCDDRQFTVEPGQAMVLHFPDDNRYWFDPGMADHWRFFFVVMHGSELMRLWRAAVARAGPVLMPGHGASLTHRAASVCLDVLGGRIETPYAASASAYGLVMSLCETVGRSKRDSEQRPAAVRAAIELVQQRFAEPIGVEDMAASSGYSRYHFTRLFTDCEGVSPYQYLVRHRLREAARQLQTTDVPIKAIARATGFTDANYFGKAFVKAFGLTPGAMRRGGMV
jgi:AraC-like DNA-binding protein